MSHSALLAVKLEVKRTLCKSCYVQWQALIHIPSISTPPPLVICKVGCHYSLTGVASQCCGFFCKETCFISRCMWHGGFTRCFKDGRTDRETVKGEGETDREKSTQGQPFDKPGVSRHFE